MPADPIWQPKKFLEELIAQAAENPLLSLSSTNYSFENYKGLLSKLSKYYVTPGFSKQENKKLESVSVYQSIDALCEGPIEGLCDQDGQTIHLSSTNPKNNEDGFKGIYLNNVAIKNTNSNSLNYNRVFADFKVGQPYQSILHSQFKHPALNFDNAWQTHSINAQLPGISSIHLQGLDINEISPIWLMLPTKHKVKLITKGSYFNTNDAVSVVGKEAVDTIRSLKNQQVIVVNHSILNNSVTSAQVSMTATCSSFNDSGDTKASGVNFVIEMGYENDTLSIAEGGSVGFIFCGITGIATAPYQRTYNVPLPPSIMKKNRFIKVWRCDGELTSVNVKHSKSLTCSFIAEAVNTRMTYPNTALVGMLFDARSFSSAPTRSFDAKLLQIRVPSNYNPTSRIYSGNWDGQFATELKWTDNPAWIFYDLATNKRYGVGKYGFRDSFVDKWNLYTISKYCDELVPTGYSGIFPFDDFTINNEGTVVSIDDSVAGLKKDEYFSRYPEGATVCLFDTKDGASAAVDTAYKRIIYNPTYENSTFSFTILEPIDAGIIFSKYPYIKRNYFGTLANSLSPFSAEEYIFSIFLESQGSDSDFYLSFKAGSPLATGIVSGKCGTQFPSQLPVLEPRFSCSVFFDRQQNAYNALNDIAAIFRGMVYWASGYLFSSQDSLKDAIMIFSNASVKDGTFNYSGSASTSRNTSVIVRYNDAQDQFKPKAEYAEDPVAIREFGYLEKEVIALGCTSKAQAHRIAKWILYTNQTETDVCQFVAGAEGSYLRPGDVIKIQDKLKTSKRYGGRIKDINYASKIITLDEGIQENIVGQTIAVICPKGAKTVRELNKDADDKLEMVLDVDGLPALKDPSGMSEEELGKSRATQVKEFTIASVSETDKIVISEITDQDFNLVKKGNLWIVNNDDSAYQIAPVEYRVLSVQETSQNEYQVTSMMYNRTKFNAVDRSQSVTMNQQSKAGSVAITDLPAELVGEPGQVISSTVPAFLYEKIIDDDGNFVFTQDKIRYDAIFPDYASTASWSHAEASEEGLKLTCEFGALAEANKLTAKNTGGYVIEVYKDGKKVRFSLDGYDNTSFEVYLGLRGSYRYMDFSIYRYDTSYKLESTGVPTL